MAKQTKGNCYLCGAELGKTAMKNHLLKMHATEEGGERCHLLKIEAGEGANYWLFVDIPRDKSLAVLDKFLKDIWLECCGHMSGFLGPKVTMFGRVEAVQVGKTRKWGELSVGGELIHEYDMGSTTACWITIVAETVRLPQKQAVRLLARNVPPTFECASCGKPAEAICCECACDYDNNPFFCATCGEEGHEHDIDMFLPITNSPRMGVCGYTGEFDTFAFKMPKK